MTVEEATRAELQRLPGDLANSARAAAAMELARGMDAANSLTSKSMAAKAHAEIMERLRELAPPKAREDAIDQLAKRRANRRAPGVAAAKASKRS